MKFLEDITIVSPNTSDPSNPSDPSGGSITVRGTLQNTSRSESDGEFSVTDWLLFLPVGTEITMRDRVLARDREFEIQGEPWTFANDLTTNTPHHMEAVLKIAGQSDSSAEFPDEEDF